MASDNPVALRWLVQESYNYVFLLLTFNGIYTDYRTLPGHLAIGAWSHLECSMTSPTTCLWRHHHSLQQVPGAIYESDEVAIVDGLIDQSLYGAFEQINQFRRWEQSGEMRWHYVIDCCCCWWSAAAASHTIQVLRQSQKNYLNPFWRPKRTPYRSGHYKPTQHNTIQRFVTRIQCLSGGGIGGEGSHWWQMTGEIIMF